MSLSRPVSRSVRFRSCGILAAALPNGIVHRFRRGSQTRLHPRVVLLDLPGTPVGNAPAITRFAIIRLSLVTTYKGNIVFRIDQHVGESRCRCCRHSGSPAFPGAIVPGRNHSRRTIGLQCPILRYASSVCCLAIAAGVRIFHQDGAQEGFHRADGCT